MLEGWKFSADPNASVNASGWSTTLSPASPWVTEQQPKPKPEYADNEQLKRQFAVEWAKSGKPFEAACKIFETDTSAALWIAANWLTDPVVNAAKDVYLAEVKAKSLLLDKDAFAAMLLDRIGSFDKEDVAALKLYADVRGFTGKDTTNINNFNNNEGLKVVFVKAEAQPMPTIAPTVSNIKSEMSNEVPSPLRIKLVSNG